jgi:hypothetical protein
MLSSLVQTFLSISNLVTNLFREQQAMLEPNKEFLGKPGNGRRTGAYLADS